jgi:hypothetical protein
MALPAPKLATVIATHMASGFVMPRRPAQWVQNYRCLMAPFWQYGANE